uniref:3-oxoacyl-[acyl-carrier-protein] reductase FabG-like n=1 Tax=Erigeron canadensis TaxID=72917 RepID=UPI001CB8F94E|nr:3-oxoacyl-[acyl-carrier-protein] reductase FabG-like [Erigeron canadensis]
MEGSTKQVESCEMEPWQDLSGKIVMVTGASAGIGWEVCINLAKSGCRIIAAARRTERLKALCDVINNVAMSEDEANQSEAPRNGGVRAVAVELDVSSNGPTIEASVRKAWDAFGHIDVLINNAGIRGPLQNVVDLSEEDWDRTFRTNVTGSWLVSKYFCFQMRGFDQGGSIVNISSIAGLNRIHPHGAVAYVSSKSALDTMTKVMAMELGRYNIRVNSIAPGLFKSEITENLFKKKWIKNFASKTVPLRDFGTTDPAMTSLLRYLIHDSSRYLTGNIFIADGGHTLAGVPLYSSL